MTTPLSDTTALVTGATSGIGQACAERLLRDGARVVAVGRRADRLAALAGRLGHRLHPVTLDVTDRAAVEAALGALLGPFGAVDVLVNSAGMALGLEPVHRTSLEDWDRMIETNCRALVTLCRLVLPGMVARGRGHVVNIGSVAGNYPYPGGNVYGATKAFVRQFSLAIRSDLLGTPVRVTNVEPGMVETEFSVVRFGGDKGRADTVYAGMRPLTGEDVADVVAWCVSRPAHVNVNTIELMPVQQAFGPFAVDRKK
jgi:3-hydroxy acid dehydrogenase / malonic semialdehyde reductase